MIQNNPILIGITGGIATGKSTVSDIIKKMKYPLIDADKIAREVVEIGKPAYIAIVKFFGKNILKKDNTIDRKALGNIIFNNYKARESLNKIIHPYIFQEIKEKIIIKSKENKVIFLDIPLLLEQHEMFNEYDINFNYIWLVYTDKETQINRLMKRDKINKEDAIKKINSQMDIEEKKTKASNIIDNRGNMEDLQGEIIILINNLEL